MPIALKLDNHSCWDSKGTVDLKSWFNAIVIVI